MIDSKQPAPEVGMGVTELRWTDRRAGTITRVSKSGKTFWFTHDTATRIDNNGMSESQDYEYQINSEGYEYRVSLRKDGRWKVVNGGSYVMVGVRREYYDYSF